MIDKGTSRVLLVDDEPGRLIGLQAQIEHLGATAEVVHPLDLESDQLADVHLVSVDQYLGPDWADYLASAAAPSTSATRAADGIAVAAAINSQLRARQSVAAIALHTADIDRLGKDIPRRQREPLLSAHFDLDWVFRFDGTEPGEVLAVRLAALSDAVSQLPVPWSAASDDFGSGWLGLDSRTVWSKYALQQIEDCRPPAHALSANTHGRSVLRWLAQRILPYPSFLIDVAYVSVLLGATEASVQTSLAVVSQAQYAGPLADFDGSRWWRAGVQDLLFRADTDETALPSERVSALNAFLGSNLEALTLSQPVIAYDVEGRRLDAPSERRDAVRLQPDGWPVYADDPWALRTQISSDERLAALVVHADRTEAKER